MIRHAGLVVSNLKNSIEFYGDLLGLVEVNRSTLDEKTVFTLLNVKSKLTYVKLKPKEGDTLLELYNFEDANLNVTVGDFLTFNHISFTVQSIDNIYTKLRDYGIIALSNPQTDETGKYRIMFSVDPDENLLEFVQKQESMI